MFGLFKKKTPIEKLQEQYQKLMQESFNLSKTNRTLADQKHAQAEDILKQIEALDKS